MTLLLPIGIAFAVIVGLGSLVWGFPGVYSLAGLMPAIIIGGTYTHISNARQKLVEMRPGVIAIAVILGGLGLVITGGFYKAASTPAEKTIEAAIETEVSDREVLAFVKNPVNLSRWNGFYQDIEGVGQASGDPGSEYDVSLKFENQRVAAKMTVLKTDSPDAYSWSLDFGPQANLQDFIEIVEVSRTKEKTVIRHTTRYRVDSIVSRMLNNFVIGDMFEGLSRESLTHLVKEFDG